jgi:environmental stress-induced protein Ves
MINYRITPPSEYKNLRWKNGKGTTTELAREDDESGEFRWRLSIAQVSENGLFSDFGGYHRSLLLLDGAGITLYHENVGQDELLCQFDIAHFDGKGPTRAELHDGPIVDFNVMTRQGACRAKVYTELTTDQPAMLVVSDRLLIYAAGQSLSINLPQGQRIDLAREHLLELRGQKGLQIGIENSGFIAVLLGV